MDVNSLEMNSLVTLLVAVLVFLLPWADRSQISIVRPEDLSQFYLNVMIFVPIGYLLPYVFRWFRTRVRVRPVLFCLLLSFLVENIQLISRRGMYDFEDIISNKLGGWIGRTPENQVCSVPP